MKKTLINDNWLFKKYLYDENFLDISYGQKTEDYTDVVLPHDASIYSFSSLYESCILWYARPFGINKVAGKRYFVYFEGVYMDTTVYVNDKEIGRWANGYTSFYFDITDYIFSPNDLIYVSVNFHTPNSRWYAGAGITRDVYLYETEDSYFDIDGLYVSCEKKNAWKVYSSVKVINAADGDLVEFYIDEDHKVTVSPNSEGFFEGEITVSEPRLWEVSSPNLYKMSAKLLRNGEIIEETSSVFGFRKVVLDTDKGLFINDKHVKMNGVCLHSDNGALGSAFSEDMAKRQLLLMKEMGVNAIRTAHNVTAKRFIELCDEMGFLVLSEAFDCWKFPKTTYDYARFFEEWSAKDIASWIRRDRNHPSIILWSAGNEIYDTHESKNGRETLKYIRDEIRKHDYKSNAYITLCSNYMAWDNTKEAVEEIKIAGYNYGERLYDKDHKDHPDWVIFGSETASCVQSRGIYHFPREASILVDDDEQCSSLGNATTSWGAKSLDACVYYERDCEYSLGQFLWSGIDYVGEPTPYHTKSCYMGMVDTAGFRKDAFYLFKAEWNDVKTSPVVHLFPYWDFNPGQLIDVRVATNADKVELYLNEKLIGTKEIDHKKDFCFHADFKVPFEKGTLKAIGYLSDGTVIGTDEQKSFGNSASLSLSEDTIEVKEGDRRLRFVEITAFDSEGNEVKNADDRVLVSVSGPATLAATDNGDNTDYDAFPSNSKRLFGGKLLVIIRPDGHAGTINISAKIDDEDIPKRKLELSLKGSNILSPEKPATEVEIKTYPENANNSETTIYQIANDIGVEVLNASIEVKDDNHFIVKAVSDGKFRLRALNKEKSGRINLISSYEFEATGFGKLNLNPYEFVSASLYDSSLGTIRTGNEKGIATDAEGKCSVTYKNVDFGAVGSKSVTLSVFEMEGKPVEIKLWDGEPWVSENLIMSGIYDQPTTWNVFKEQTFELNSILKGVHNISITTEYRKIHIKGFLFTEYDPTYAVNNASDVATIYGDSYEIKGTEVVGIGNNVSLQYEGFDFKNGATKLYISGRSRLNSNTLHLLFTDESGVGRREIIEISGSDEYAENVFEFENITGKQKVTFLFLPGSEFDFNYFRFE